MGRDGSKPAVSTPLSPVAIKFSRQAVEEHHECAQPQLHRPFAPARNALARSLPTPLTYLDPADSTSVPLFLSPKLLPRPADLSTLPIAGLLILQRHAADWV